MRTDGHLHMTKLTVAFRKFANAPKNKSYRNKSRYVNWTNLARNGVLYTFRFLNTKQINGELKVVSVHATKEHRGMEVQFHSF
jgi:hypothetical protein